MREILGLGASCNGTLFGVKLWQPTLIVGVLGGLYACGQQLSPTGVQPRLGGVAPSRIEAATGESLEALSEPAYPVALPTPDQPDEPQFTPEILAQRAAAQRHLLGAGNEIQDAEGRLAPPGSAEDGGFPVNVDGNALGYFIPIENDDALQPFYDALRKLERGEPDATKVRVLSYGASHTQGDFYTGYLRHYLQARFGNGGLGFIQFAQLNPWYRSADATVESNGFKVEHAQRKITPEHQRYGLLGAAAVATSAYASGAVERASRARDVNLGTQLELFFMQEPAAGDLTLQIDGQGRQRVKARAGSAAPGYASFDLPETWATLKVRPAGNGPIRLFGGVLETDERGIVVDTLGINGTRAANMLNWNEALWADHVSRRDPQLVMLAYGTNESVDTLQPIEEYEEKLGRVLDMLERAAPKAACLLIGPGDFPKEVEDGFVPRPRLLAIVDVQRKLAFERGCGFFDTLEFMGGEGAMRRWASAKPPMAAQDRIHLTARGYVRLGMVLGDALMLPYDRANSLRALRGNPQDTVAERVAR